MDLRLDGKYALVGGGSKGLGKASAMELAALGASVTLVAREEGPLRDAVAELPRPAGQEHGWLALDYDRPDAVREAVERHLAHTPCHILVTNTGGPPGGPLLEAGSEAFLAAFTRHLLVNQLLARLVVPGMRAEGYGRIINVISTSVKVPLHGLGVSNTIRGAVASWAKTLANECAPWGITVNNVLPGASRTERLAAVIAAKAQREGRSQEEIARDMQAEIPMGRFAEPHEVGAAGAFLASPAAAYISGINLPVDGGRTGCL